MTKVYIEPHEIAKPIISYMWTIFCHNKNITFTFINEAQNADVTIGFGKNNHLQLSEEFYTNIKQNIFSHKHYLKDTCLIYTQNNIPDYLSTCFYMINSLQEYNAEKYDELGRFQYIDSYQYKFKNVTENIVQKYFNEMAKSLNINTKNQVQSDIFISHDIDSVYGAWIEDGFAALKKGRADIIFKLLLNLVIQKPDWFNIDRIMRLHSEYDYKTTFFWIANKGKVNNKLVNADYDISSNKIQSAIQNITKSGFENGIHKSVSSEGFSSEIDKLGFLPKANRYHYLKFNLPNAYNELEFANIEIDSSLGFAEHYGFRNSYGQAFQPFSMVNQRPYNLVEVPLQIMDRTFFSYMKTPTNKVADTIINFFESNKYNCNLSLLWHNNFFNSEKYLHYGEEYKKILSYLYESNFKSITQKEIIDKYLIY